MSKYILLAITFTFILSLTSNAQNHFDVQPVTAYISQGEKPGFEVFLQDGAADDLHDNWKKYLKRTKAKVKTSRKSVEYFADNAKIPSVSDNTVDIYSIAQNSVDGAKFMVFVDLGGAYISENAYPLEYGAFLIFMNDFLREEQQRILNRLIEVESDKLSDLEDNLDDMIKQMDNNREAIGEAKAKIAELEAKNETLINDQSVKRDQIGVQKEIIQVLKSKAKR